MTVTYVTGTDTDVGKTLTTAALAAALAASGATVAVYKPTQTGVAADGHGDVDEIARLSGVGAVHEGIRLGEPMAPRAAAQLAERELPDMQLHVDRIMELAASHQHVLVEGAGGLLVELDGHGRTLRDVAAETQRLVRTRFVVVCRSGLGTLNHTRLTLEALRHKGHHTPALVVGSWPATPSTIERSNLEALQNQAGAPFLGSLPAKASELDPSAFRQMSPHWLNLPAWARADQP
ncbi:dethiobiotin synthase [Arthrobacter sp. PAMC 25486]|uniref:dethiobiotin synthase n=1 Tax=Arthrobacter sp. PAMC 25486 TaxID=1494608 RepID=UPI000535FF42|nr:dethiobiotin synthase [Arthrobacter sp. PAMC 25486]AIY00126.1 dethiobiotin synthase [Arthrobacter sp. PAMC 25486]